MQGDNNAIWFFGKRLPKFLAHTIACRMMFLEQNDVSVRISFSLQILDNAEKIKNHIFDSFYLVFSERIRFRILLTETS